jgi:hypothetical protein
MGVRITLLAFGILALLTGLCGAMGRLGWTLPHGASLAALHGPVMISGLFGTLIGLERSVALGSRWSLAAPMFSGIGTLALVVGAPTAFGAASYVVAAAILSIASLVITIRQPAVFTGTMCFGALSWLAGNILWLLGEPIQGVVGWWLSFLIMTIAGERLEMSRLLPGRKGSEIIFLVAVGLLAAGSQNGIATENGAVLYGLALVVTTLWLMMNDIARVSVRRDGITRFMAVCMLSGYVWLGLAGIALIAFPPDATAYGYDLALHAVLIGFVLSMVFGHALVILPAVARIRVRYAPVLYAPLSLLHVSIMLRIGADLAEWDVWRKGSGILTLLALLAFVGSLAAIGWRGRRARVHVPNTLPRVVPET